MYIKLVEPSVSDNGNYCQVDNNKLSRISGQYWQQCTMCYMLPKKFVKCFLIIFDCFRLPSIAFDHLRSLSTTFDCFRPPSMFMNFLNILGDIHHTVSFGWELGTQETQVLKPAPRGGFLGSSHLRALFCTTFVVQQPWLRSFDLYQCVSVEYYLVCQW